jgi:hypothetical protein
VLHRERDQRGVFFDEKVVFCEPLELEREEAGELGDAEAAAAGLDVVGHGDRVKLGEQLEDGDLGGGDGWVAGGGGWR